MPEPIVVYTFPDLPEVITAECYWLLLVTSGQGVLKLDAAEVRLQPYRLIRGRGALTAMSKGTIAGFLLLFDHCGDHRIAPGKGAWQLAVAEVAIEHAARLRVVFRLLQQERSGSVQRVYLELLRLYAAQIFGDSARHPVIGRLLELIDRHYLEQPAPGFYARELGLSPRSLNKLAKVNMGKIVAELLKDRRLREAERLLLETNMRIKEIAYALEFTDQTHFAKFFRKYHAKSPGVYRLTRNATKSYP